jgi:hypothetical protein
MARQLSFLSFFLTVVFAFMMSGVDSLAGGDFIGGFKEMEQEMMSSKLEKFCIIPKLKDLLCPEKEEEEEEEEEDEVSVSKDAGHRYLRSQEE